MSNEEQDELYKRILDEKLTPVYESYSLHLVEERYEVDGKLYTVFLHGGKLYDLEPYQEPVDWKALLDAYWEMQREAKAQLGHS